MLKRLFGWIKNHPIRSFLLTLFFPVYGGIFFFIVMASYAGIMDWYYEKFPFSTLAVRLFAEPGEDTLMFRYRLGDRLLYVRSDVAMPARYSGREEGICNPLWGECRVSPLRVLIYRVPETDKICIGRYPDCAYRLGADYNLTGEFSIYSSSSSVNVNDLLNKVCFKDFYISTYGNYKDYYVDRAAGRKENLCDFIQPNGVLDSLLTAMETGNYDKFPRNRKNLPPDRRPEGRD
ncbi:hypothetical protein [Elstera litoralis]|uniref:hypothetical protein n=2 Tax=Elstera litoralis TaxID=552518 RepID=UPI0012EE5402|nr:hypothetical protein [Elstera litoralis]